MSSTLIFHLSNFVSFEWENLRREDAFSYEETTIISNTEFIHKVLLQIYCYVWPISVSIYLVEKQSRKGKMTSFIAPVSNHTGCSLKGSPIMLAVQFLHLCP